MLIKTTNGPDITEQSYTVCIPLWSAVYRIPDLFNVQKCAEKFFHIVKNIHWQKSFLHTCTKKSYKYLRSYTICTQSLSFFNSVQVLLRLNVHFFFNEWIMIGDGREFGFGVTINLCVNPSTMIFTPHSLITSLHTLQRQNTEISKQIFPEKKYRGLSHNFHIHASVSDLYITTIGLPILLEEICRPILGLYKSLTDTWMWNLGLRPRYFQKRNT